MKKIKRYINNILVEVARKSDSTRKNFYYLDDIAYRDSADFIYENIKSALLFKNDIEFWKHVISTVNQTGYLLEFGVFSGITINFFAGLLSQKNDNRIIYGFDSFEGLSENWSGTDLAKGHFNVQSKLPEVKQNVKLIKGWIDNTLPEFVAQNINAPDQKIAFIHIDVDTYDPTKSILIHTKSHLKVGTIILFDELLGYPSWRHHEYKALTEIFGSNIKYEFIAFCEHHKGDYTESYIKAAIRITEIETENSNT